MALELTQPLLEVSTRNTSWGVKAAGVQDWRSYHIHVPSALKSDSLNFLEPSGPIQAHLGIAVPLQYFKTSGTTCTTTQHHILQDFTTSVPLLWESHLSQHLFCAKVKYKQNQSDPTDILRNIMLVLDSAY